MAHQIHLCATGWFSPWSFLQSVIYWLCLWICLLLARWPRLPALLGPDELGWCSGGKWHQISLCLILPSLHS
ncbi:hypothetical protein AMECASPLE_025819, partial [Ameca splendens]